MTSEGDFDPQQQLMEEQRDAALREMNEAMGARGMGASGAAAGMGSDIYRQASGDISRAYQGFRQEQRGMAAQAAQMMFGDRWNQMDHDQQMAIQEVLLKNQAIMSNLQDALASEDYPRVKHIFDQLFGDLDTFDPDDIGYTGSGGGGNGDDGDDTIIDELLPNGSSASLDQNIFDSSVFQDMINDPDMTDEELGAWLEDNYGDEITSSGMSLNEFVEHIRGAWDDYSGEADDYAERWGMDVQEHIEAGNPFEDDGSGNADIWDMISNGVQGGSAPTDYDGFITGLMDEAGLGRAQADAWARSFGIRQEGV